VIDCNTGMSSDAHGARITFGITAPVNDHFLEMVRTETHRGLEGRALAGFTAGGKPFGFGTVPEPNPQQADHPRKLRIIKPDEAVIVVRIFKMFAKGMAPKKIAAQLNADGIPAPRDGGKGHKLIRGWGHTAIRHVLRNENYIGNWTWNRHRFVQIPGTNGHRHFPRPESEHVRTELPDLRIIPPELWLSVQQRLGPRRTPKPARLGTGEKTGSVLAGHAKCGVCGGAYGVVARRYKNDVGYTTLGCGTHASRGAAICSNGRTISAKKLMTEVLRVVRDPVTREAFYRAWQQADARPAKTNTSEETLKKSIAQAESRVSNLIEALATVGYSPALAQSLKTEEVRLEQLRNAYAAAQAPKAPKRAPLSQATINKMCDELANRVEKDPTEAPLVFSLMPELRITPEVAGDRLRVSGGFKIDALLGDQVRGSTSRRDRD
jgi:site-specific DNA recombinase